MAVQIRAESRSSIAWSVGVPGVVIGLVLIYWPTRLHWGFGRRWVVLYDRQTFVAGLVLLVVGVAVMAWLLPRPRNLAVGGAVLSVFGVGAALIGPLLPMTQGRFFGGTGSGSDAAFADWIVCLASAVVGGWLLGRWARLGAAVGCGTIFGAASVVVLAAGVATVANLAQHAVWFYSELEHAGRLGYVAEAEFGDLAGGRGAVHVADVNLLPAAAPYEPRPPLLDTTVGQVPFEANVSPGAIGSIRAGETLPDVTKGLGEAGHEPRPCSSPHPFYVAVPVAALDLTAGGRDQVVSVIAGEGGDPSPARVTDYGVRLDERLEVVVRRSGSPAFAAGDAVEVAYVGPPSDYRPSLRPTAYPNTVGELYESTCRGDADAWGGLIPNPVLLARLVVVGAFCVSLAAGAGWAAARATRRDRGEVAR